MPLIDADVAEFAASGQWRCTVEELQEAATRLLKEKRAAVKGHHLVVVLAEIRANLEKGLASDSRLSRKMALADFAIREAMHHVRGFLFD